MNPQKLLRQTVAIGLTLLFAIGCAATPPTEEQYEKVDPRELYIVFEASLQSLTVDAAGNIIEIEGVVTRLAVGDKPIELSSDKILLEGTDAFVVTKDYGKIKITSTSTGGVTIWLKPSQKEKLKELLN